jgi:hypothetical protein
MSYQIRVAGSIVLSRTPARRGVTKKLALPYQRAVGKTSERVLAKGIDTADEVAPQKAVSMKQPCTYAIHFTDGAEMDSLTLDGAMRAIAIHHRVKCRDLITDTTEEKILVWLHPGESSVAEVIVPRGTAATMP